MSLIDISNQYFKAFSNKDLSSLEKIFSSNIRLKDWDIEASGLENVLKANKKIFDSVESIIVKPLRLINDENTVIAELEVFINRREEILYVTDFIEFDEDGKITVIRAYKG